MGREPAEAERALVHLDGGAIETDRLLDRLGADRHQALLVGKAQEEHVRGDRVPEQAHRVVVGIEGIDPAAAHAFADRVEQGRAGNLEVGVLGELARDHLVGRHDHRRLVGGDRFKNLVGGGNDEVAAEHDIGAADADADRLDVLGPVGELEVTGDRAALLGKAGHVDRAEALALDVRGLSEDRGNGDDARAADAGDEHGVGLSQRGLRRIGQAREHLGDAGVLVRGLFGLDLPRLGAVQGDEARAEAVEAGEVLVAGRLVDLALAPERRLLGNDGDTVRFHAAVAAAFADLGIDEDALVGIGEEAALAPASLL